MSIAAVLLPLLTTVPIDQNGAPPQLPREFRGVWVATVDNIDWPSKRNLSSAQQQAELIRILDQAAALNLNAIVLQVRPATDALYNSRHEPWSEYLTGKQGQAPNPYWDPLHFAVTEAHKRGMELHCWFNPYRSLHPSQKGPVAANHISKTHPNLAKKYGKHLWLDPSEPLVQKRSLDVMLDVVRRYDVDGVHIDDYFYPYKEKGPDGKLLDFPDGQSWQRYRAGGGRLSRGDWRRKSVDDFIQRLYGEIKREKKWVKFGISPFGIFRPGYPAGIKAGVDQYADLYADARKWFVNGWCDYYTPQLYWPIKQTAQSYPVLLDWWVSQNAKERHLWPGNFTSRLNPADGNWSAQELVDQIEVTRNRKGATGNIHFSMKAFSKNWNGVTGALREGVYSEPALVPASPWLDSQAPGAPQVEVRKGVGGQTHVTWSPNKDKDIKFYVVSTLAGRWSRPMVTSNTNLTIQAQEGVGPSRVSVIAIDRAGNESPATVARL